MAGIKGYNGPGNIFSSSPKDSTGDSPNSVLATDANSYRNGLLARNLYTPTNQYPIPPDQAASIVNSIDSVLDVLAPFKSFDLNNTVFGRLVGEKTPLTTIGLALLGKQFAYNEMSHIAQQTFPVINVNNLFDGNKSTKLFTIPENYSITKKVGKTGFKDFIEKMTATYPSYNRPFNKFSTSDDYLRNTGEGHQHLLLSSLNRNLYKEKNDTLVKIGDSIGSPIQSRSTYINENLNGNIRIYFNFLKSPYLNWKINANSELNANININTSYINTANVVFQYGVDFNNVTQEYAPNYYYVKTNFGDVKKSKSFELSNVVMPITSSTDEYINGWIDTEKGFMSEGIDNQIIWGSDGVSDNANSRLATLRGLSPTQQELVVKKNLSNEFNVNTGLLKYTSELLNATDGNIIDITRKIFMKGDSVDGFNGSGLYGAPSHSLTRFASQMGVRQHTILDQYDRFAKAIRYDGNKEYGSKGGNENSVIYRTVMPRIHPTREKDTSGNDVINNKNLMFSIENLAVRVISKDSVGIIDDDMGTAIPVSEVGPFNGRIMWFPPYNIEVFETTAAKYESTVMIGRGEPMYNYQNSERSATLSFTLLIDYPPQLRDGKFKGHDKHKIISEFFAFGMGTPFDEISHDPKPQENINPDKTPEESITIPPEIPSPKKFTIFFENNVPSNDQISTCIETMYKNGYEVDKLCTYKITDTNSFGLNKPIYTGELLNSPYEWITMVDQSLPSQYSNTSTLSDLDKQLQAAFTNEDAKKYYEIQITGAASKLYLAPGETAYNNALGKRRAEATGKFILSRLKALGISVPDDLVVNMNSKMKSVGSADAAPESSEVKNISTQATKSSRYATIEIKRKSNPSESKKLTLTPEQKTKNKTIDDNTLVAETDYYKSKRNPINDGIFVERESNNSDSTYASGFQAIEKNIYVPAYHSQTPEDFHRRLVFLQQCMRQGNAQRKTDGANMSIKNSVFGRQPICILRIGDFYYTKVIIDNLNIDYAETTWDMNPEGFGMQPMIAKVTLQMKIIGGQSLIGPIDALQNAVSFNYYANSTFSDKGMYFKPSNEANNQKSYMDGILATEKKSLENKEKARLDLERKSIAPTPPSK